MTKQQKQLASSLDNLPIEVGKIQLWLVYRGLKPMATIDLDFDLGTDPSKQLLFSAWLKKAQLKFRVSQRFNNTIHVSRDVKNLDLNFKYELLEDQRSHLIRGKLYGIPQKAAKVYAEVISQRNFAFPHPLLIHAPMVEELFDKYWYPYIEYLLRREDPYQDSLIAKRWADLAREEIPQVAATYEKRNLVDFEKLHQQLIQIYG